MQVQGIQLLTEWKPVTVQFQDRLPDSGTRSESPFAGLLKQKATEPAGNTDRTDLPRETRDTRPAAPETAAVAREESRIEKAAAGKDRLDRSADSGQKPEKAGAHDGQEKVKKALADLEKAAAEENPDPALLLGLLQQLQKVLPRETRQGNTQSGQDTRLQQALKALEVKLQALPDNAPLGKAEKLELEKLVSRFKLALQEGKQSGRGQVIAMAAGADKAIPRQELAVAGHVERKSGEVQRGKTGPETRVLTDGNAPSKTVKLETETAVRNVRDATGQRNISRDDQGNHVTFTSLQQTERKKGAVLPPDAKQVFSQIVERARITHKSGMSEMRLQLNPKSLGKVGMRLVLQDGAVSARLSVANTEVRELISRNLESLQRELREAGINLAHLDLTNQGGGERFQRQIAESGERIALHSGPVAEPVREIPAPARRLRHEGSVDVVA